MEIYIACFSGLLSSMLLLVVYLADRYEREPIDLIQNSFLTGVLGQLLMILAVSSVSGEVLWWGPWLLVTIVAAALVMPFQLQRQPEMDERFDGIVYTVSVVIGAICVIHVNNLPWVIAASPYRDALLPGAEPDLRDLLIVAGSRGVSAELGRGLVVVLAAIIVGAVIGVLQFRGWAPGRSALVCAFTGIAIVGLDVAVDGSWWVRCALTLTAIAVAVAVKRRSVFRERPEPSERDLLVMGLKTILLVLGAALLATVVLQSVVEQPGVGERGHPAAVSGEDHHS